MWLSMAVNYYGRFAPKGRGPDDLTGTFVNGAVFPGITHAPLAQ